MQSPKKKQAFSNIIPITNSGIKNNNLPQFKHFQTQLQATKIILTYSSNPSQSLTIKILNLSTFVVCQLYLTSQGLNQMDASVLATFDNLQTMYIQFVEIIKTQPKDFTLLENGSIRIKITVAMKSGIKKKDLMLETDSRLMNQVEKLQLQMDSNHKKHQNQTNQLKQRCTQLQKQLAQSKNQNKELKSIILQLKKQLKKDIQQIKNKFNKQKQLTKDLLTQLRQNVDWIKQNMAKIEYSVKNLTQGAKKIILVPDKKNKCFTAGHKQNTYNIQTVNQGNNQYRKITKLGKQKWTQLLFEYSIAPPICYFQLQVVRSKNNYICVGVCSNRCLEQEDCKWSKQSITLFLLDNSIIAEGKQYHKNPTSQIEKCQPASNQNNLSAIKIEKEQKNRKIRVIINCVDKTISWHQNQNLRSEVNFSQEFLALCTNKQVRPLVICADQDDQLILL